MGRLIGCVALLGIASCTGFNVDTTPPPDGATLAAREAALRRTRVAFDSALKWRDTVLLRVQLDGNVTLRERGGTTVTDRSEVARVLLGGDRGRGKYSVVVSWGAEEACVDGVVQKAVYSVDRADSSATRGLESGEFIVKWNGAGTDVRLSAIVFLDGKTSNAAMTPPGKCKNLSEAQFGARSTETSFAAAPGPVYTMAGQLEHQLNGGGWTRSAAVRTESGAVGELAQTGHTSSRAMEFVDVARRVSGPFWVEARFGVTPESGTLLTYNAAASSELREKYTARFGSLTLRLDWRDFQLAIGPTLGSISWREEYLRIIHNDPNGQPNVPIYATDFTATQDSAWQRKSLGTVGSLSWVRPITSRLFWRVGASSWIGAGETLPGVATHQNWNTHTSGRNVSADLGLRW